MRPPNLRAPLLVLLLISATSVFAAEEPALICGCPSGLKKGDTSITFAYQRANVTKHFDLYGEESSRGRIKSNAVVLAVDHAFSDRLQMSMSLPYVSSSYHGAFPHPSSLDNGAVHSTYQDLRADLRYHMVVAQARVTPFIGYIMPTHSYQTLGHASAGHNLHEQVGGINIERSIEELVPGAYVQGRYAYTVAEKVLGISHNRSNLDLNVGYFVLPSLSVRATWSAQKTYGGLDINPKIPLTGERYQQHDRVSRVNFVAVGAGASYALNDSVDLFMGAQKMLSGRNGHKLDWSPSLGLTWSFSTARSEKSCPTN